MALYSSSEWQTRLTAPETLPNLLTALAPVALDSLTISRDAVPHHFIARAVILDLSPAQIVAAIVATEDEISKTIRTPRGPAGGRPRTGSRFTFTRGRGAEGTERLRWSINWTHG